jgi:hypothetical protein
MRRHMILDGVVSILIIIFVYASLSKILDYRLFVEQLLTHPYLKNFAGAVAWMLPLAEITVAVLLIFPRTRKVGLYGSAALLMIFTVYLGLMLLSGKNLPCTCGGFISWLNWPQHIIMNVVLILLSILGIWLHSTPARAYMGSTIS